MERKKFLQSVGFSDTFLRALEEFEKSVPEINIDTPFLPDDIEIKNFDTTGQITITKCNDDYNYNLIITQS